MITAPACITAPNFAGLNGLVHGFGLWNSVYPAEITLAKQIHSAVVLDIAELEEGQIAEGDALISNQPGVIAGVKTADCVPILLVEASTPEYELSTRVVAAIHAGWRGTAENIAAAAVSALGARYGVRPENLRAAIGPSIGPCCYETGPEVARRFGPWYPELAHAEAAVHLDLAAINELQLRAAGISDVWKSGECTFCRADRYYSFRRQKQQAGRMLSFIGWQKHVGRTL
jgi:polyphenol oxidase